MQIVDFESCKMIFSKSEKNYIANGDSLHSFMGSCGQKHMDIQGNTYAFGVLLLEIISGRPPYCKDRGCLVDWVSETSNMKSLHCLNPTKALRPLSIQFP